MEQTNYTKFKDHVCNNKHLKHEVALRDVEILSDRRIKILGNELRLAPPTKKRAKGSPAFISLLKVLGMSTKSMDNISAAISNEPTLQLIDLIRKTIANNKNQHITAVFDPISKTITNFSNGTGTSISVHNYFRLFEVMMNKNPSMNIKNFEYDNTSGLINMVAVNPAWEFEIPGMADEKFNSGIRFRYDIERGLLLDSYNDRLVCDNGMVRPIMENIASADNVGTNLEQFVKFIETIDSRLDADFKGKVVSLATTPASLRELLDTKGRMVSILGAGQDDDAKKLITKYMNEQIPTKDIFSKYRKHGHTISALEPAVTQKIRTPFKAWDLVNSLTYSATHIGKDIGVNIASAERLRAQRFAGIFVNRTPDLYMNNIPQLY